METIIKALELFISKDEHEYRLYLTEPFSIQNTTYASDGIGLMSIAGRYCNPPAELPKDFDAVVAIKGKPLMTFLVDDLDKGMSPEFIDEKIVETEYAECKDCNGDGQVEWEYDTYTSKDTCPVCEGEGQIEIEKVINTGKKVPDSKSVYKVFDRLFSYANLVRVVQACQILNVKELAYIERQSDEYKTILTSKDGVNFYLFPLLRAEGKPVKEIQL